MVSLGGRTEVAAGEESHCESDLARSVDELLVRPDEAAADLSDYGLDEVRLIVCEHRVEPAE